MLFDSTNPLTARSRFRSRSAVCLASFVVLFLGSVWVVSWLLSVVYPSLVLMLVGDVVALGICYFLYLQWHDQPIKLTCCKECEAVILSNTPWVCGYCKEINRNANQFPFVHKCAHCGDEAKAYKCHHCGKLIFLTEDQSEINYAYSVNAPTEMPKPDEHAEKLKKLRANKDVKAEKLSIAEMDAALLAMRNRIKLQNPKKKSATEILEEEFNAEIEWERAEAKLNAAIDEEYKHDSKTAKRMKKRLEKKIREGLPDRS